MSATIVAGRRRPALSIPIARCMPVLSAVLAAGLLAIGAVMLLGARADAWDKIAQSSNNLSIVMARDIARNIARYDLSIQGAIAALTLPGLDQASPALRQAALFDKATSAAWLGALVVADAAGNVLMTSQGPLGHPVNVADREHFAIHRDHDIGLYVGRPVRSRLDNGPIIALSRRVNDSQGGFAGAVIGGMRLAYFQDLFAKLNFGAKGTVTLFRTDGRILARYPLHPADIDADLGWTAAFRTMLTAPSGQFIGRSERDGEQRLFTFRHIGDLPLILSIGYSVNDIHAAWRAKAIAIGGVLISLSAATAGLGELFRREMRRRLKAERGLVEAADELSTLAATDGLTGLDNRRSFDAKFEIEWRRAIRTLAPLALLMIDADFFKRYNDTYGHPEGDAVLRAIAGCIRQNTRRPGDLGARYGGEEFVVMLPDTDLAGATSVADRLRAAVAGLAVPHQRSPIGHVSISIGVATTRPRAGDEPGDLLNAADAALLAAKQSGRNQVQAATQPAAA